jgi:hypothetical protein
MAADTILQAKGDYSRQKLMPYVIKLVARFGIATTQSSTPSRTTGLRNYLAGILLNNKWFTRHVLLDRWFLHSHQDSLYAARD